MIFEVLICNQILGSFLASIKIYTKWLQGKMKIRHNPNIYRVNLVFIKRLDFELCFLCLKRKLK